MDTPYYRIRLTGLSMLIIASMVYVGYYESKHEPEGLASGYATTQELANISRVKNLAPMHYFIKNNDY